MPRQSHIDALPTDLRQILDRLLLDSSFSGYEAIANYFKERGYSLSKSSVHRYGQKLEQRLQAIKASTDAAKLIVAQTNDDADALGGSVLSIIQSELFEALINIQEAEGMDDVGERITLLSKAAKSIAELSRASINTKKWQIEVRTKAQVVADKAAQMMSAGGMSAETVEMLKREIMGIPS